MENNKSDSATITEFKATRRQVLGGGAMGAAAIGLAACTPLNDQPPDKVSDLKAAQRVFGLDFDEDENQLLAEALDDQLESIRAMRAQLPANDEPPACTFSPQLKTRTYAAQDGSVALNSSALIPPFPGIDSEDAVAFAPLTHLAHWVRTGQTTSAQLTSLYLRRILKHNPKLECFVTVTADLAMAQAKQADNEIAAGHYKGPLHGIPYGVKDLMDVAGVPTSWGAAPYKDRVAKGDAHIVTLLRDAGAVLLGKTTCGALAWGDTWFGGVTRNPWNTLEGASGSSAGSGSATSAGLVGFAIGTETLGSIVSPSNRNGITGLRPTFGRVGRSGTMALCWSLDKIGPMCRGVEDTALVLAVLNGPDQNDPANLPHGFSYNGNMDLSGMRIGLDPSAYEAGNDLDKQAMDTAKDVMASLGAKIVEVSTPTRDVSPLGLQLSVEAAAAFQDLTLSGRDDELRRQVRNAWPHVFREAHMVSAVDLVQVDRLRRLVMQDMAEMFDSCDVLIGPNYANEMLLITNYTGQPQLSLPCGFEERELDVAWSDPGQPLVAPAGTMGNMTRNISCWAPLYEERRLIAVGRHLEAAYGMTDKHPTL